MRNSFFFGVGGVVSADIAVPDHGRELEFYSKVLTTGKSPLWREDLNNNAGTPIIGLGAQTPEYESLPLQWMPHFQVADVANSVASARELGGKELWHSKTEDGQSQWAVLVDLDGAAFGIIPAVADESESADQKDRIGCISWLSLTVSDASPSQEFYQRVIGWKSTPVEATNGETQVSGFEMQIDSETVAAEICTFSTENANVPSVWLLHLPVDDLAESVRRVVEGGGEVILENVESKSAVIRDPVGVCFALQAG